MDKVIFSNKLGVLNVFYVAMALVAAGAIVLAKDGGDGAVMMVLAVFGIFIASLATIWLMLALTARDNVSVLTRTADGLTVEMVHMFGRGRKFALTLPRPEDWNWEIRRYGKGKRQSSPVVSFRAGGRTFRMWLSGARVLDKQALAEIAPDIVREMQAAGAV